jgi:hypothetical protein
MANKVYNSRYCWVYMNIDHRTDNVELSLWSSPSQNGEHLDAIKTPFVYQLTRNDIRYYVYSEVELSQNLAIRVAGTLYDTEFVIAPKLRMKSRN